MKELRKHFDAAKGQYESARYPGDLAAEVFSQRQTSHNGRWVVAAMFAAAAVLFIMLWMNVPQKTQPGGREIVRDDPQPELEYEYFEEEELTDIGEIFVMSELPALSLPAAPDEVEFAPAAPEFSLGVPSFSLLGDGTSNEETNQEEPVL